eukprot:5025885-Pyramimonas_sp.AAC.1
MGLGLSDSSRQMRDLESKQARQLLAMQQQQMQQAQLQQQAQMQQQLQQQRLLLLQQQQQQQQHQARSSSQASRASRTLRSAPLAGAAQFDPSDRSPLTARVRQAPLTNPDKINQLNCITLQQQMLSRPAIMGGGAPMVALCNNKVGQLQQQMLGGRAMVGGAPPPMVVFCNSLTYRSSNAHLTKRSGPPGPGWSTGLEAPRWAAWRTGLRASLYG